MTDDSDKIKQAENDKKFAQERENRLKKYVNNSDEEDDDQNFIKKDDLQEAITDFKKNQNLIKPKNNQQRNLDRETGGLEEDEEKKEESEKDVWDDRSEEVDKMGATDTFNTTSMKSVVWEQKQKVKSGSSFDDMGYVQRLKNLKQDHSHENNGGRGI